MKLSSSIRMLFLTLFVSITLGACGSDGGDGSSGETATTYTVGGTVSGLTGALVLQNNSGDYLAVSVDGSFTFATALNDTANYSVSVLSQPAGQSCSISSGSGSISSANEASVSVTCSASTATTYTVGGTVSSLAGILVLQNNSGDNLTVSANGSFTFATAVNDGDSYSVSIFSQPTGQSCSISNGLGNIASIDVTNVQVSCTTSLTTYTVGGSVSGLAGTLTLQNNDGDDWSTTADGSFTFLTPLNDSESYSVTVSLQPTGQNCTVSNGSGIISGGNITSVAVNCVDDASTSAGGQLHINETVADTQDQTVTAMDDQGNFVVVWRGQSEVAANRENIYARLYNSSGVPVTGEFRVNQFNAIGTYDDQEQPNVAMNSSGEFVVVWHGFGGSDSTNDWPYARIFNADGSSMTGDILVDSTSDSWASTDPSVAMNDDGSFIVVYDYEAGFSNGLVYRRFNASGTPLSEKSWIIDEGWGNATNSEVAIDGIGNAVIVWKVGNLEEDIQFVRLGSNNSLGALTIVNTTVDGTQTSPAIAMNDSGDYVIAWYSTGVFAQRYDSAGNTVGSEFQVSSELGGYHENPAVAMRNDGAFVVAWDGYEPDGTYGDDVYYQTYDSSGSKVGGAVMANDVTSGRKEHASIAVTPSGMFFITWVDSILEEADGNTANNEGIYGRLYPAY